MHWRPRASNQPVSGGARLGLVQGPSPIAEHLSRCICSASKAGTISPSPSPPWPPRQRLFAGRRVSDFFGFSTLVSQPLILFYTPQIQLHPTLVDLEADDARCRKSTESRSPQGRAALPEDPVPSINVVLSETTNTDAHAGVARSFSAFSPIDGSLLELRDSTIITPFIF